MFKKKLDRKKFYLLRVSKITVNKKSLIKN